MPLVKNAATNLAQGVSQQAESQRYPSQATEQINAYSSPIKGLVKRPPTKFISNVEIDTNGNAFAHTINRDSTEQYTVVVSPHVTIAVNSFNTSTSTLNISTEVDVNDAVRINLTTDGGRLPTGLSENTTYYVLSKSASGSNWNITLSKTKGGSLVRIGKVEIDSIRITSVKDGGTGQWVDGAYEVTFAANHGFVAGDLIKLEGLTGKALTLLGETAEYELRVPDNYNYHFTYANNAYTTATWSANKFILGVPNANKNSINDNLGYHVDIQWKTDGDESGYTMVGDGSPSSSNLHFVLIDGAGNITHTKGNKLKWDHSNAGGAEATWPTGWDASKLVGAVIRLGSRRNKAKAYRATVTAYDNSARTLTLDHYVDLNNELFDSDLYDNNGDLITSYNTSNNPKWIYIGYWSDTTTTTYSAGSNPRQLTAVEADAAYVGANTGVGNFQVEKGGIKVFDIKTGTEQQLNIDKGLEYITSGNDPKNNLKAVTVADYTFLVNKTVPTAAFKDIKYEKKYEAIITTRMADYGKRYKVKVGTAANPIEVKPDNTAATVAYVDIAGRDREEKGDRWIARIQSKTSDPKWNGWQIRVIQNWDWNSKQYILPSENPDQVLGHTDKLPPLPATMPPTLQGYYYKNEKVSVHVDTISSKTINIYGNFYWANNDTVKGNLTTVQDIIDFFKDTPELDKDWEVKTLTGTASSTTAVVAGDDTNAQYYTLQKCIVGKAGVEVTRNGVTYVHGRNESISSGWVPFHGNTVGTAFITAGYLSPSVKDTNIERKYYTSHAGRTQAGADWDTTTGTAAIQTVETGEYWYKTPKWTGNKYQQTIGTEHIAEMLASSSRVTQGKWVNNAPKKANGRTITTKPAGADAADYNPDADTVAALGKEEAFGMTYQGSGGSDGYLYDINAGGSNKILGEDSDGNQYTSNWQVQQQGYTIALMAPDREQFQITVEDDLGGNGLKLTYFEVGESTFMPDVCRQGHIVKVVGNVREEADDYYLRFEADDPNEINALQHGRWVECVGYEQRYKFDPSTMPVGLIRESDGSFTLKELDWNERQAGDETTNPFPSFTGNTINDVFLFRNRLGFLSGENIIFSESGEYFNFFRSTTAALLDTAPIDVTASTDKVSTLHSAIPYKERLIIFSDQTQFVLDADPFLSVKTVTLSPSNEIESLTGVKPVVSGSSVFYGYGKTDYSGVGELTVAVEDADQMDTSDATGHVPKYIKGSIRKIAAATNEDVVCFITDDTTSATLYVYKYFTGERNEKMQAAWFKYTFGAANDYITDISFIGNTLYMILRRSNVMYLESLTFEDDIKDTSMDYLVRLDRKRNKSDFANNQYSATTITLPYNVTANTRVVTAGSILKASTTTGSTTFTLSGVDLTAVDWWVGELYDMEYTFSQPFLKSDKTTETGRYQIQRGILEYANARSFDVEVTHNPKMDAPNKQTITNTFANDAIHSILTGSADLQDGFFKFGVQGKNDKLQLKIKNNTPYPSDFLSIDYEARAFSRGSRWRG